MGRASNRQASAVSALRGSVQAVSVAARRRPSRPAPRPGERRPVLMRVKPYWAALIRDGSKTVELRRQRSGCEPGTTVVIYTSFPVKQVQAVASVKRVHALAPEELWRAVGPQSAVAYEDFMAYLGDLEVAYGIELTDLREVAPFALARSGPQSWSYLFADEPAAAAVLAACQLELT